MDDFFADKEEDFVSEIGVEKFSFTTFDFFPTKREPFFEEEEEEEEEDEDEDEGEGESVVATGGG